MALFHEARKARIARVNARPDSLKTFVRAQASVKEELEALQKNLQKLDAGAWADQANWGYAGSMNHILDTLRNLNSGFNA